MSIKLEDSNLFMMCKSINKNALSDIPNGYHIRNCKRDELNLWFEFPFDNEEDKKNYRSFMEQYFKDVYGSNEGLFFEKCLFICDENDTPVGTCFAWKAYNLITTIHWFKVKKEYEGQGIGRALISYVINSIDEKDFPIFLHTQAGSFRAIKLYTDLGFVLLTDEKIGYRENHLNIALPYLKKQMPLKEYNKLKFDKANKEFLYAVETSEINQF
ncbi:GNAT family N-acetyltransferase [Brachyspira hyodysenteriae]|uniref:GNAT family N-acetyltransferase n=1 Tax=Brachyspira hyodysenteriae TaxID=159 RepID=UPI0011829B78|nr:GNAT family N-acetyltransferase [Brachyspira hyodysenteriae]MCZ9893345.1 GNAT family N-acetyltransferase [Brachyspira hyodysenteriae]MCZ9990890.1 GNAT family N-acetyltransferase [Brachyspira hyodysenteriae]MCZ9999253.1 GNAT family N-acetyltransferase [Brachyspira hyodysenteriae]MDA0001975.1 GNAT family N-acetyltransferase [Brachyspira hyodysenteriae]MDA0007694.1 GNAT family N-acetyltransferase [Brachyspira hyodysenteriae]